MMRFVACLLVAFALGTGAVAEEAFECTSHEPLRALSFDSRYAPDDPSRATLDVEQESQVLEALAPLDGFIADLSAHAQRLYRDRTPDRRRAAACIVSLMAEWAEADALSELGTETVELTIGSRLSSFGLILWQVAPYARDDARFASVVAWLERRVAGQMVFWDTAPEGAQRGNLRAWAALSAATLGLMSEDDAFAAWATASMEAVMCTAAPDGSLPQEMSRGPLALHYQLHAVAPLVTATAILERQGVAMQDRCGGALHRVVAFALDDLNGAGRAARITGKEQSLTDEVGQLPGYRMAWVEPYLHLRADAEIDAMVDDMRPLNYTKLGGNQTVLWGR